jgi:hypothetical protein
LKTALLADGENKGTLEGDKAIDKVKKDEGGEVPTYPAGQEQDVWAGEAAVPRSSAPEEKKGTEEEELAKRFERLKRI